MLFEDIGFELAYNESEQNALQKEKPVLSNKQQASLKNN